MCPPRLMERNNQVYKEMLPGFKNSDFMEEFIPIKMYLKMGTFLWRGIKCLILMIPGKKGFKFFKYKEKLSLWEHIHIDPAVYPFGTVLPD